MPARRPAPGSARRDGPPARPQPYGIAVAGAGLVGMAFAVAVKAAMGEAVAVVVHDPGLAAAEPGAERFFAIAPASRHFLTDLGVWAAIAPDAQPILRMEITDSRLNDPIRPVFLSFAEGAADGRDGQGREPLAPVEPLAHMVAEADLRHALRTAMAALGVVAEPVAIRGLHADQRGATLTLADGRRAPAALVVAADGRRSRLREAAGIGWIGRPYGQHGIVATISHGRDHQACAVQHFLPSGPFAILPLTPGGSLGHRSSIVWSERNDHVETLRERDESEVLTEVARRFGASLGPIALETPIVPYPLAVGIARRFVGERLALIGDAAHVIHPIAGQGLNLGLADAAALADGVIEALRLGLDPGQADTLTAYERARRAPSVAMGLATDGLNRLFGNDALPVRLARDVGLGLVDRMPRLKAAFMRYAAGEGRN